MSKNKDPYFYKTVRAEWYVHVGRKEDTTHYCDSGPYPSEELAQEYINTQVIGDDVIWYIIYKEADVDIDPILTESTEQIARKVENWVHQRMIQKKKQRRTQPYFSETAVKTSLSILAREIRSTFKIYK